MSEEKDEKKDAAEGAGKAPEAKDEVPGAAALIERELFLGLIQSFQAAAMQQMGKVMNPFTEKIERDMPHAKLSIEMLEMLRTRTSGNLTGQEARFLNHVLTELRLNYVAEVDKDKTAEKSAGEPAA
jgi:hypothetical protein